MAAPQVESQAPAQADHQPVNQASPRGAERLPPRVNHFAETLAAKRQAAVEALRADRGVPQPAEQAPRAEQAAAQQAAAEPKGFRIPLLNEVAPATTAAPKEAPPAPQVGQSPADYAQVFAEYEKRRAAADAAAAKAEKVAAEAAAKEARLKAAMTDPASFMAEAGMTQAEWENFWLNNGKLSPEMQKIKELEQTNQKAAARLEAIEKQYAATQQKLARQQTLQQAQATVSWDKYPFVNQFGGADMVLKTLEAHHARTGQVLDFYKVTENLENNYRKQFSTVLNNPAIRDMVFGQAKSEIKPTVSTSTAPKTLSSQITSQTGPAKPRAAATDWKTKRDAAIEALRRMKASG